MELSAKLISDINRPAKASAAKMMGSKSQKVGQKCVKLKDFPQLAAEVISITKINNKSKLF